MYIDTHAHIFSHFYPEGITEVLEDCRENHIQRIHNIGTEREEFSEILSLSSAYPNILLPSLGLHPDTAHTKSKAELQDDLTYLASLASKTSLLSIGECGFDYKGLMKKEAENIAEPVKEKQYFLFLGQVSLALELHIPLVIHCREAVFDLLPELIRLKKKYKQLAAVIHSLDTTLEEAQKIIELGFYVSFNGIMTFKNAHSIQRLATMLPLERIVLETDSPFLAPTPLRGEKNEPAHIVYTYEYFATLRHISLETLQVQMQKNALALWGERFA